MHQPTKASTFVTVAVACIGCALIAAAAAANQAWFDHHFLPSYWTPREDILRNELFVRIGVGAIGVAIVLLARIVARRLPRDPLYLLTIPLAVVLAFGAAEVVLRQSNHQGPAVFSSASEPRSHLDARLGWLFDPSRTGLVTQHGSSIAYTFDRNGYRVASLAATTDFEAPTIVFTGESIMVGHQLAWGETIAAQTTALLGVQSATIAVSGFATDQAYLRLKSE